MLAILTASALVNRSALSAAIAVVDEAIERRNHMPILSNAKITGRSGGIEITGTDLDIEISAILSAAADPALDFTASSDMIKKFLKGAPKSEFVSIDNAGDVAVLDFERVKYKLQTLPSEDFPNLRAHKPEAISFDVSGADIARGIANTLGAVSTEETRYYLNGIFFHVTGGRLFLVATDGHRLYRQDVADASDFPDLAPVIVPRKACKILAKLWKGKACPQAVSVTIDEGRATFAFSAEFGSVEIRTKTIDGTFPDYQRVIPALDRLTFAEFNADELAESINACSLVSAEKNKAFKLSISEFTGGITVNNPDSGSAESALAVVWPGDSIEIGFNAQYMLDAIDIHGPGNLRMGLQDAGSPCRIERDGLTIVVMPTRV